MGLGKMMDPVGEYGKWPMIYNQNTLYNVTNFIDDEHGKHKFMTKI